jgi:cytochrome c
MKNYLCFAWFSLFITPVVLAQDARSGKDLFLDCASCHSTHSGEQMSGPSLAGIFGRKAGSVESFRYSNAVKKSGVTWDANSLNQYIADPQSFIPGGRMPYSGMPSEADRKKLIEYLQTLN